MQHVGVEHYPVDDRVGHRAVAQLGPPARGGELRAQDEGSPPVARLDDLQHLPRLVLPDRLQEPIVDDEQVAGDVALSRLGPCLVLGHAQLVEHLRQPDVPHRLEGVARRYAEGAGDPRLPGAGGARDDEVAPGVDPLAVGEVHHPRPVELAVRVVAHVAYVGVGLGEAGLPQQPRALVRPPGVPLRVDQHGQPLVERHVGDAGRRLLLAVGPRHHRVNVNIFSANWDCGGNPGPNSSKSE